MRLLLQLVLLLVTGAGALALEACPGGDDELKTGAKVAHRSFVTLRAFRDVNASLRARDKLTSEEFGRNVLLLQTASATGGELIAVVDKALTEVETLEAQLKATPGDKAIEERLKSARYFAGDNIRPKLKAFATAVRTLNDQGVLQIKDESARAQLGDVLSFVLTLL